MKTKDGKTKVYITENGHTKTIDISEISDVPVKGARDITEEYYNAHKEDFEQLGYRFAKILCPLDVYELSKSFSKKRGMDIITIYNKKNIPVFELYKNVDPFDENSKIWMPPKEEK